MKTAGGKLHLCDTIFNSIITQSKKSSSRLNNKQTIKGKMLDLLSHAHQSFTLTVNALHNF